MRLRIALPLALAVTLALPLLAQQDLSAKRLKLLQQEKYRILKARREILIQAKGSPRAFFKIAYSNIAKGNKKQRDENVQRVAQCQEYAQRARQKGLGKKVRLYEKLSKLYVRYAKQNDQVLKAYKDKSPSKMAEALAEIEKIEQEIISSGLRPAKRDWFTMKEIESTRLPGQKTKATATRR